MPLPITWLLDQLAKESAVVSQAPLIFTFSCLLVFAAAYLLLRWQFKDILANRNALIASLRDNPSQSTPASSIWEQDRKAINQAVRVAGFAVGHPSLKDIGN